MDENQVDGVQTPTEPSEAEEKATDAAENDLADSAAEEAAQNDASTESVEDQPEENNQ